MNAQKAQTMTEPVVEETTVETAVEEPVEATTTVADETPADGE